MTLDPVTGMAHDSVDMEPGATWVSAFGTINATTITFNVHDSDEVIVYLHSPLWPEKFVWFTDLNGAAIGLDTRSVLAANAGLHTQYLEQLRGAVT